MSCSRWRGSVSQSTSCDFVVSKVINLEGIKCCGKGAFAGGDARAQSGKVDGILGLAGVLSVLAAPT